MLIEKPKVLLIDDDVELGRLVVKLLVAQAIEANAVTSLAEARQTLSAKKFDVLVLDIMLPDGNGLDFCREVRAQLPIQPILMLSARGDTLDRVLGLEIGADDYLAKPFEAAELVARVRALVRRAQLDAKAAGTRLQYGRLKIDMFSRTVEIDHTRCDVTANEFKLLVALSAQPGSPLSRDALSRATQPGSYLPSDRSVDVQITRLRKKLRDIDGRHEWISTVRGEGYVFTPPAL
jgi:two-component system, OmpR family, phosphate regulon response regulator OmpR